MERDCFIGDTPIQTSFGLSFMIKDLNNININVLGWNQEKNGMKSSKKTNFLYKGEKECIDIYLEDGRKITCTPEHKLLTSNNEWIKANELITNTSKLKCSVKYPNVDINNELQLCNNWSLQINSNFSLKTNTQEEYFKSMVFCRLLGYLLTDGYINNNEGLIYIGHQIDLERLLDDIKLFVPITQGKFIQKNRNIYVVNIPSSLLKNILDIDGIMTGAKVSQQSRLPEFLVDDNCPLPLVREFLAGLFGGDGHTCNIAKNTFTYISFSKSKVIGHLESLKQMMEQIKTLLSRFDITGVTIQEPKINSASKKRLNDDEKNYEIVLHLNMHELIPFHEKIGFRYCCHKNQRLEAAVSYTRLREGVIRQKKWIINRVDEILKTENISKKCAIEDATEDLEKIEPLLHSFSIPSVSDLKEYLINGRNGGRIPSSKFPTSTQYLESIGALEWFTKSKAKKYKSKKQNVKDNIEDDDICKKNFGVCKDVDVLPTMNLKVIDIRPGGTHPVYDIQVENEESFLANGVVAHNCMIAHGALGFLKERMMDVSDIFTIYICQECGLFSVVNPDEESGIRTCTGCDKYSQFMELRIPYACKLLMQELEGMMITPRFKVNN